MLSDFKKKSWMISNHTLVPDRASSDRFEELIVPNVPLSHLEVRIWSSLWKN